jgi:hypothetical protein
MRLLLVYLALFSVCFGMQAEEVASREARYAEASYNYSQDPTKAVLTVSTSSNDFSKRSLILFGDGRMEIYDNRRGSWEGQLEREAMDILIHRLVNLGLAEWDGDTIRSWQLQDLGGPFPGKTDAMRVRVLFALEDYQRGSYRVESIQRTATVRAPGFVERTFPDIPQFKALAELSAMLSDEIKKAEAR